MAQPLPRYEELGVRVAPVQPISLAGAEAAARASGALVDNLNRLTNFAFEEANKQARAEGIEFGAANAPTAEQIKAAADSGSQLNVPGDTSTTYGRAARESALAVMKQNVEVEARNKIAELHATARQTEMDPSAYQKQMQAIIDGYGSAVAKVSPATAFSVRASLSTMASSQFIAHSDWYLTRQQAKQKIANIAGIDTLINSVESDIAAGDSVLDTPNGPQAVTAEDRLNLKRVQITRLAASVNDPDLMKTKLKEFNDKVEKAQTAYISTWTQDGSTGVPTMKKYDQIMSGKIDAADPSSARVQQMWKSLTLEHRTKVQDEVRRQMGATLELDSKIEAARERQRKEDQANNRVDFMKAWQTGDAAGQTAALEQMQKLHDSEGYEKYSGLVNDSGAPSKPGIMFQLENEVIRGTLTSERVATLVTQKQLSFSDARSLLPKIEAAQDKALESAMKEVKARLGYPDRPLINPTAAQRAAEQQVQAIHSSLLEKRRAAIMSNGTVDYWAEAQKQIEAQQNKGPSQQDISNADAQVKGLRKQLNLPDDATLDAVKQALAARVANKQFNSAGASTYYQAIDLLKKSGAE